MTTDLWVYVLMTITLLWAVADHLAPYKGAEQACRIGYVYDGDTVELICGGASRRARLVGFDAPETTAPRCPAEADWGHRATLRLRALVESPNIRLFFQGQDKYHRDLVLMQIEGRDVAEIMISEELAVAYSGGQRRNWCGAH
jgi:micrococcal nuclease